MCVYSDFWIEWEKKNFAPYAVHSDDPWHTKRLQGDDPEQPIDWHGSRSRYRTPFEIDADRITNSTAFRRLEYKTQMFVTHEGDNYRTRLTHSLEVAEIARHISKSLRLNEKLAEACALGHDLGHAPYGHEAENAINHWLRNNEHNFNKEYFFCHNFHSVENVDYLEPGYDWDRRNKLDRGPDKNHYGWGMNLTNGVREGILTHTSMGFRGLIHRYATFNEHFEEAIRHMIDEQNDRGLFFPGSLEAQVVRISDDLAQRIHDLEDGIRSRILNKSDIKEVIRKYFNKLTNEETIFQYFDIEPNLIHRAGKESISMPKVFIDQIVEMVGKYNPAGPSELSFDYKAVNEQEISKIDTKYKTNPQYQKRFKLTANIAFLLHMWRDAEYLTKMNPKDQWLAKCRILKYLELLLDILGEDSRNEPSAYIYVAFLRGLMLANVIEHSFWRINKVLNAGYDSKYYLEDRSMDAGRLEDNKFFVIFAVVDGLTFVEKNRFVFEQKPENLYCFEFEDEKETRRFIDKQYKKILMTNGAHLPSMGQCSRYSRKKLHKVIWLNKFKAPEKTEFVKLVYNDGEEKQIPISQVRIYFTGYKEICPGAKQGSCKYAQLPGKKCTDVCAFFEEKVNTRI